MLWKEGEVAVMDNEKREACIDNLIQQIGWIEDIKAHQFPGWGHVVSAMRQAVALLEAQEPRLLGLDEIKMLGLMWLESRNGFVQPVICQDYEYGVDRSVEFIMVHGTICNSINTFGKLWRVWTSKPSDEQRKAEEWK